MQATTRKVFIAYKKRFSNDANNLFNELEKNVQKQINEDEKILMNIIEIKVDDSIDKKNINLNTNSNNIVKKSYSSSLTNLNNSNIKKNNINLPNNNKKANNESITNKSSLNITPVKPQKQKTLYASNIKQKSYEIKFAQKNLKKEIINNKTYNKNKINS